MSHYGWESIGLVRLFHFISISLDVLKAILTRYILYEYLYFQRNTYEGNSIQKVIATKKFMLLGIHSRPYLGIPLPTEY